MTMIKGAKTSKRASSATTKLIASAPTFKARARINPQAYEMAKANKHKPWARRWLRQHGL